MRSSAAPSRRVPVRGGRGGAHAVQAPNANAVAERWIGTVRAECLDWLLVVGREHLEQVLRATPSTTTSIVHTEPSDLRHRNDPGTAAT